MDLDDIDISNVRDSDTSLWLHNKLGTSNDSWIGESICSQLSSEVLLNVKDCFPDLQTAVKLKLLLSFFHIPTRNLNQWKPEIEEVLEVARADSDRWVSLLGEVMKPFPSTFTLTEVIENPENKSTFDELFNDIKELLNKSVDFATLPMEYFYLNKPALSNAIGQPPLVKKHFGMRQKSRSAQLKEELMHKAQEVLETAKHPMPVIPLRSRGMPRKMTDTAPSRNASKNKAAGRLKGTEFGAKAVAPRSLSATRTPAARKDGGIKLLDIADQPTTLAQQKKRKRFYDLEETTTNKRDESPVTSKSSGNLSEEMKENVDTSDADQQQPQLVSTSVTHQTATTSAATVTTSVTTNITATKTTTITNSSFSRFRDRVRSSHSGSSFTTKHGKTSRSSMPPPLTPISSQFRKAIAGLSSRGIKSHTAISQLPRRVIKPTHAAFSTPSSSSSRIVHTSSVVSKVTSISTPTPSSSSQPSVIQSVIRSTSSVSGNSEGNKRSISNSIPSTSSAPPSSQPVSVIKSVLQPTPRFVNSTSVFSSNSNPPITTPPAPPPAPAPAPSASTSAPVPAPPAFTPTHSSRVVNYSTGSSPSTIVYNVPKTTSTQQRAPSPVSNPMLSSSSFSDMSCQTASNVSSDFPDTPQLFPVQVPTIVKPPTYDRATSPSPPLSLISSNSAPTPSVIQHPPALTPLQPPSPPPLQSIPNYHYHSRPSSSSAAPSPTMSSQNIPMLTPLTPVSPTRSTEFPHIRHAPSVRSSSDGYTNLGTDGVSRIIRQEYQRPYTVTDVHNAEMEMEEPAERMILNRAYNHPPNYIERRDQYHEIQDMFHQANKLTRQEKAVIMSFLGGSRVNPCPHLGNVLTIKLSENVESVVQPNGTMLIMKVETHIQMNYASGEWKRIKKYKEVETRPMSQYVSPVDPERW